MFFLPPSSRPLWPLRTACWVWSACYQRSAANTAESSWTGRATASPGSRLHGDQTKSVIIQIEMILFLVNFYPLNKVSYPKVLWTPLFVSWWDLLHVSQQESEDGWTMCTELHFLCTESTIWKQFCSQVIFQNCTPYIVWLTDRNGGKTSHHW